MSHSIVDLLLCLADCNVDPLHVWSWRNAASQIFEGGQLLLEDVEFGAASLVLQLLTVDRLAVELLGRPTRRARAATRVSVTAGNWRL